MKTKSAPCTQPQLRLKLSVHRHVELPEELVRQLVTALADLLVAAAASADKTTEGGSDERQDSR